MRTSVTIAIPAYNAEAFIEDTINSIIQQTYSIDEIIIYDDCSDDNTILRVNEFIEDAKFKNIRLIENEYNLDIKKIGINVLKPLHQILYYSYTMMIY